MGTKEQEAHRRRARRRASPRPGHPAPLDTITQIRVMNGVTYDTGALIAADHNDRRMWALHAGFLAEEVSPTIPAPVLAEAWRGGGRQANLSRLLALCSL